MNTPETKGNGWKWTRIHQLVKYFEYARRSYRPETEGQRTETDGNGWERTVTD